MYGEQMTFASRFSPLPAVRGRSDAIDRERLAHAPLRCRYSRVVEACARTWPPMGFLLSAPAEGEGDGQRRLDAKTCSYDSHARTERHPAGVRHDLVGDHDGHVELVGHLGEPRHDRAQLLLPLALCNVSASGARARDAGTRQLPAALVLDAEDAHDGVDHQQLCERQG